jgi:hypothetical protein
VTAAATATDKRLGALKVLKAFMVAVLLALLVTGIYYVARWGVAGFYAGEAVDEMNGWTARNPVTRAAWSAALADMQAAVELDSTHPDYQHWMGRFYRIQLKNNFVEAQERSAVAILAKSHFQASLDERPRGADTWAEYALLKSLLREIDGEFEHALAQAVAWGPWEMNVLRLVTAVGLHEWAGLSEAGQALTLDTVVRGLRSPMRGVSREIRHMLEGYPAHKPEIVRRLVPALAAMPWRRTVQYDYLLLTDWAWAVMDSGERALVAEAVFQMLARQENWERFVRPLRNKQFRLLVCLRAMGAGQALPACSK